MKIRCYDIQYDTDGLKVKGLPKELLFEIDDPTFSPHDEAADLISDKTGWCVMGFQWEKIKTPKGRKPTVRRNPIQEECEK